jgi:hypothetical protein
MDATANQQPVATKRQSIFSTGLRVVGSIINLLMGFLQINEEDLMNAGIYFGE